MPSSRAVGTTAVSMSRLKTDHSDCTAVIGATAAARRIVSADASESPMWLIFPASTSSVSAPTVSSIGTDGSARCW